MILSLVLEPWKEAKVAIITIYPPNIDFSLLVHGNY